MKKIEELTVLLVDDEPEIVEILSILISKLGCKILTAHDGIEAFDVWSKHPFVDVVITDVMMPGENADGITLTKKIRENCTAKPTIIVVTGFSRQTENEAKQSGADFVMAKPFSVEAILEIILNRTNS